MNIKKMANVCMNIKKMANVCRLYDKATAFYML